jgi:hypothetical protein
MMREAVPRAVPPIASAVDLTPRHRARSRAGIGRGIAIAVTLCAMAIGATAAADWWWRAYVDPGPRPIVAHLDLYARMIDLTPLTLEVGGSDNAPWQTTIDELQRNPALWRLMHLENWNAVAAPLREQVLDRILAHYRPLLMNPRAWDDMTAADWDAVPQPVRTVAYRQMCAYWAGFYDVGGRYGIDRVQIRDTLQAIAMSESWFEHRAERIDFTGNHDIGLVQASDFARERIRQLAARGIVDVSLADEDYWNPWQATRFLAIWMSLLLDEARGDLDLAVRAYNRGIARANDRAGDAYLAAVQRRRHRFIRNHDAPPAWTWLSNRAREIEAQEWPWLHGAILPSQRLVLPPGAVTPPAVTAPRAAGARW